MLLNIFSINPNSHRAESEGKAKDPAKSLHCSIHRMRRNQTLKMVLAHEDEIDRKGNLGKRRDHVGAAAKVRRLCSKIERTNGSSNISVLGRGPFYSGFNGICPPLGGYKNHVRLYLDSTERE